MPTSRPAPHGHVWRSPMIGALSLGTVSLLIAGLAWTAHIPAGRRLSRLPGVHILTDAEMRGIVGGWLEPKARKPRADCRSCQQCQAYSESGGSPDGASPSLDATTAEAADRIQVAAVGSPDTGLRVSLSYGSHLADGTNSILDTTLGAGWTHTYGDYLLVRGSDYIWVRGDGEIVRFTRRGTRFTTSTGHFFRFQLTGPTTAEARDKDGTLYRFRAENVAWPAPGAVYVLDRITDRNQRVTTVTYAAGLPTTVNGPYGHQLTFQYDAQHKLTHIVAASRTTQFAYGAGSGQLSTVVLPNDQRVSYTYNAQGQLRTKTVPGDRTYTIDYNGQGRAFRLRDPSGSVVAGQTSPGQWAPDHDASLSTGEMHYVPGKASVTDGRGNTWTYEYDARGCVTRRTNPAGGVVAVEYDSATLLPTRVTDENLHVTVYQYDARGNRTLVRDAEGNETRYEYEPVYNQVTRMVEPDGDEWRYVYDAAGNLIEEIDPLHELPTDATIHYSYLPDGLRQSQTNRNGNTTLYQYDVQGHLTAVVDPAGALTTYSYDAFGNRLAQVVHNDTGDQVSTYAYDARDRLIAATDPVGSVTRFEYDSPGNRVRTLTDWVDDTHYHARTDTAYDQRDRPVETIDDVGGVGRTTRFEYDGNGNRVAEIDANGVVTRHTYDPVNRLIRSERDPGGLSLATRYQYDPAGNRVAQIDPNGHTTAYQYDALNRLTRTIDPLGQVTENRYFAPGGGGGGCACGTPGSSTVQCTIDADGRVTRYEYDALDRRVAEIRPVGPQDCAADPDGDDVVTRYRYDPNGNRLATVDPNGNTATSAYTPRNEVAETTNGAGEPTRFAYDAAGNRTELRPPNGNVVRYSYDAADRLTRVSDSIGDVSTYAYDAVGNRVSTTDALGHTTLYLYDGLDRPIVHTDPMGQTAVTQYDAVGNVIRTVDREGNVTEYTYDAADRRTSTRQLSGGADITTTYGYDGTENLTDITDPLGRTTTYSYDAADRLIREVNPDGTDRRYQYDGTGHLTHRFDEMGEIADPGNLARYSYDELHRLTRREYANGEFDQFTYDPGGRMLSAENAQSRVEFTYDAADRVASTTQRDIPQTYAYSVEYAYDAFANTRTVTYPSGRVVLESRDPRDRLSAVNDGGGPLAGYAYDLADRLQTKAYANGTETRYQYNLNNWPIQLRHLDPDTLTTNAGFEYAYDREGNRLRAGNLESPLPYDNTQPVTHSERYAYDDLYRLTEYKRGAQVGDDVPSPRRHRTWELDPLHNWTRFGVHDLETGESADYCNSVNQVNEYDDPSNDGPPPVPDDDARRDDFMVSPCPAGPGGAIPGDFSGDRRVDLEDVTHLAACVSGPWVPQADPECADADLDGDGDVDQEDFGLLQPLIGIHGTGVNLVHDKNGNLLDDGERLYFYDRQVDPSSRLRAENRLTRVLDKASGQLLAEYRYDALGRRIRSDVGGTTTIYVQTRDWRCVEEYDNGLLARSYAYGDLIDEVLAVDRATADRLYYHANPMGSTLALTDTTGAVVERYAYDAYGSPLFADGAGGPQTHSAAGNRYLFAGGRYDPESGLYHLRARQYDPRLGRFLQRDPLLNQLNLYHYVADSPTNYTDNFGLFLLYVQNSGFTDLSRPCGPFGLCGRYSWRWVFQTYTYTFGGPLVSGRVALPIIGEIQWNLWVQRVRAAWGCLSCSLPPLPSGSAYQFWEWFSTRGTGAAPAGAPPAVIGPFPGFRLHRTYFGNDTHAYSYPGCQCVCAERRRITSYIGFTVGAVHDDWGMLAWGANNVPPGMNALPGGAPRPLRGIGIPIASTRHEWGFDVACAGGRCREAGHFGTVP